ncbi:alpha-tocopherol transfer protein-like [Bacillus rossius redtenbacheri]|uniref:alpha-tocopherol transfer protein-like n=1 Tax=Bacillus rossius redtenbacheri TaxID=93214 RepID=UPI002FDCE8DB
MKDAGSKLKQPFLHGLALKDAPDNRQDNIAHIRSWLDCQPHLPEITDDHLHLFLHSCYDNLERTKTTLENYFSFKSLTPELFSNRDPLSEELQHNLDIWEMAMLPRRTPEGYIVSVTRFVDLNPSKFVFLHNMKNFFMFADTWLSEDGLAPGIVTVFDAQGVSFGHLARISPLGLIKKLLFYVQDCMPIRLKAVYIINTVPVVDKIMALVKPFLKSELASLIHIHTSVDTLGEGLPLEILPEEYGGKAGSLTALYKEQRRAVETEYADWLIQSEDLRSDESKRVGESKVKDTLFGAEGSFRKLDID